jgi:FlaG/FlaF family flagellin (archaellin)
MKKNTGSRWEITVDGKPRGYRDVKQVAIASAEFLKSRNPNVEVTVRDLETDETTVIKNPSPR